jgi:hypothetical protein
MSTTHDNAGALFRNDRRANDRQPDYKGEVQVEGRQFWLSAWLKEARSGTKYLSLALRPKEEEIR